MRKIIGKVRAAIALDGTMILLFIIIDASVFKNEHDIRDLLVIIMAASGVGYELYLTALKRTMIDKYKKFYFADRIFSKYRKICQTTRFRPESECQQILQFFTYHFPVKELPEGWYITVTHEYVIKRLKRSKNVRIVSISSLLYSEKLARIRKHLIGKDCGKCVENCLYKDWNKKVNFHIVKFKVEEKRQEL